MDAARGLLPTSPLPLLLVVTEFTEDKLLDFVELLRECERTREEAEAAAALVKGKRDLCVVCVCILCIRVCVCVFVCLRIRWFRLKFRIVCCFSVWRGATQEDLFAWPVVRCG